MPTTALPTAIDPRVPMPTGPRAAGASNLLPYALAAIVAVAFSFLLWQHAEALWRQTYYQFFPFVLLGSAALAWSRWGDVGALVPGSGALAAFGFVVAWGFLAIAEVLVAPGVAYVGALVFLASATYKLGGQTLMRAMLPAWALLWIVVPLPFRMGQSLLLTLQTIATQWSSFILDTLHVFHVRDGNVIQVRGQRLLVEEACTGANSLFAVVACCLFLVFWQRQRWYRALVLLVASVAWVIVTNTIRIVVVALASDRYGVDLGNGLRHDLLGFACFALAVLLIWSTDRLLLFLFPRWGEERPQAVPEEPSPTLTFAALAALCPAPLAAAFVLPLAFHLAAPTLNVTPNIPAYPLIATVESLNEGTLKDVSPEWKLVAYKKEKRKVGVEFGDISDTWLFDDGKLKAVASLDYPFPAFHDLWLCFEAQGWTRDFQRLHSEGKDGQPEHWVEMKCKKSGLHAGYVVYCETNSRGDVLPFQGRWTEGVNRFEDALGHWFNKLAGRPQEPIVPRAPAYQIQVYVEANGPLTEDQEKSVKRLFFAASAKLQSQLFPEKAK